MGLQMDRIWKGRGQRMGLSGQVQHKQEHGGTAGGVGALGSRGLALRSSRGKLWEVFLKLGSMEH